MGSRDLVGKKPGILDIAAVQGDDFLFIAEVEDDDEQPIDVTGWTVKSEVRETFQGDLLVEFTVETAVDDVSLADNELRVSATAAQMSEIGEGRWPWDLKRVDGPPDVSTIVAGTLVVRPNVTEG